MERPELAAAVEPDALRASLAANAERLRGAAHAHHGSGGASLRTATYKGRQIVIRTTYEITVDGQPFAVDVIVDNSGRVYYHGLPTRDFPSTVTLVKKAIDLFPDDFPAGDAAASADEPSGHAHAHAHGAEKDAD